MTMNREILFRGKSILTGSFIEGNLVIDRNRETFIVWFNHKQKECWTSIYPYSVGQYTGLTDKNGNKIFEGDILHLTIPDGSIRHFVVEWANESRTLKPLNGFRHDSNPIRISGWCFNWEGHRLYPSVIDGVPDNERMEIVGNIHDNPELLKG